jgi:hypothetical protein
MTRVRLWDPSSCRIKTAGDGKGGRSQVDDTATGYEIQEVQVIGAIRCYHPVLLEQVTTTTIYQPLIWIIHPKPDSP